MLIKTFQKLTFHTGFAQGHVAQARVWLQHADALRRRDATEIELAPPTFVSLTELARYPTVEEALETVAKRENERFQTRIGVAEAGPVAMWHGDAGYLETDPSAAGGRHRLTMVRGGPWSYERSF